MKEPSDLIAIERVQTGARIEKRLLKVLKALADLNDMSLGDLLEAIVLHAFEDKLPFSAATLLQIEQLKKVYGVKRRLMDNDRFIDGRPNGKGRFLTR